jgi:hypothetical protein
MNTEQAWLFDKGEWSRTESLIHQYWKNFLGGTEETREKAIAYVGYDLDSKATGHASPFSFNFYPSIGNTAFYGYIEVCIEGSSESTREGIYVKDLPSLLELRNLLAPNTRSNIHIFASRE